MEPPQPRRRLSDDPPPQRQAFSTFPAANTPPAPISSDMCLPPNLSPSNGSFYKTRLCHKFIATGTCPYGDSCTFAHGSSDLRQPPPHWEDISRPHRAGRTYRDSSYGDGGNASGLHRSKGAGGFGPFGRNQSVPRRSDSRSRSDWEIAGRYSNRHGFAESKFEVDMNSGGLPTSTNDDLDPALAGTETVSSSQNSRKWFPKLEGIKKLNGIYADWID
ncbi:zinc finger CCCH domain-containing protein 12-like [Zingiber officinale]|uniref:zinc finger CCCH domain-containing protein 12-like n=1 Tax=Zingiber officinale TaxID=94328 RepID=UPI001C4AA49F|nr:zinc finger CCCH domain-containing protein 12-like [Zingiber officinale]